MHGAGEQQPQLQQQQQRYRFATRNDEPQPTTSHVARTMPIQASLMCTPTTMTTTTSSGGGQRVAGRMMLSGQPIKIGNNILEPAGTLVFSGEGPTWSGGQRVVVHANKHAVVQANLFPIGSAPILTSQQPGNWYMNQQPSTSGVLTLTSNNQSSGTPDSGIQSVPTSPPTPSFLNDRDAELDSDQGHPGPADGDDESDPDDFTDMPTLKPVDEDDDDDVYDIPSTSSGIAELVPVAKSVSPGISDFDSDDPDKMNAEEILTMSIAKNMDVHKIVKRLLHFDPVKANEVAVLIKKTIAEDLKKKKEETEVTSTTPTSRKLRLTRSARNKAASRKTNSPDVTTSNLRVEVSVSPRLVPEDHEETEKAEVKRRGRKPKRKRIVASPESEVPVELPKKVKVEEAPPTQEPESAMSPTPDPVQYRLKVRELISRKLDQLVQQMSEDMKDLSLPAEDKKKVVVGGKRSFIRELNDRSKKLRLDGLVVERRPRKPAFGFRREVREDKDPNDEDLAPRSRSRLMSSRRSHNENTPEIQIVEEKYNGEYYEIVRSVPSSDTVLNLWKAPKLTCGCTKGACTSDMDCLNRALRVQCGTGCTLTYCSNRRFWKEDNVKQLTVSNGPRTKRNLKTKIARKAGEFLCEFAGEVVTCQEAHKRFQKNQDSRIVAIGSELFVDATNRGNVARFIKHSCRPNSRLEVWSVSGVYRAGVFSLNDLTANSEITIDKNGLLPSSMPCNCGSTVCKKVIVGARRIGTVIGDATEAFKTRRFLPRNRRKTIETSRRSGLPSILFAPDDADLKIKKVLAAVTFRIRRIDGTMSRTMLPHYHSILRALKSKVDASEFLGLIQKWLDVIDDDDLERAFVAIKNFYLPGVVMPSAQPQLPKKPIDNAPKPRALPTTSSTSPVSSKRSDADLSYLESLHPIGSYDPDAAWETYRASASDNAVRCICGALDEDGGMVQCDKCHFWLHIDCCEYHETKKEKRDQEEYICIFCEGKKATNRPEHDILLADQPDVRFENCDYYRALMNRRGIQVRLNETVYVNRVLPEDHKVMLRNLREEKKGGKGHKEPNKYRFPKAPTTPLPPQTFNRKETRIFRVERLFICPGNNRFVFGSFYAWPHETYADTGRTFSKKEVFATPYYETLPLDEVIGRCLVVDTATWCKGRPKVPKFKEDDVFLCEMQIGKNQRVFEKIPPKNRYPINTQPYVFAKFSQPKKVVRDFRPYELSSTSPKPPKTLPTPSATSKPLPEPEEDSQKTSRQKNIQKIHDRLLDLQKKKDPEGGQSVH